MDAELPVAPGRKGYSKSSAAAEYIVRLIADGRIRAGTRVPQAQVANVLGMSTVPVREALQMLERDGWVTIEPHRGAFVNPITEEGIKVHYGINRIINEYFIRNVFERRTPTTLSELDDVAARLSHTASVEEGWRLVNRFLQLLVSDMPDSKRVATLMRTIVGLSYGPGNTFEMLPNLLTCAREVLGRVAAAVRANDVESAVAALDDLMESTSYEVIRHYRASGVLDDVASEPTALTS